MLPSARKDAALEAFIPLYQNGRPSPGQMVGPKLTEEETNQLLSLAILSLTASHIPNWRFVIVKDAELRKQIRQAAGDQAQVTDASLLIILCAGTKAWEKHSTNLRRHGPDRDKNYFIVANNGYALGKEELPRDEAMCSCGIAAQTLMLAAKAMGYDSSPLYGFDADRVGKLINLPPEYVVAMFVVLGKNVKDHWPRNGKLNFSEVVITDQFE